MDSDTKKQICNDLVVQFLLAKGTELFLTRRAGLLEDQEGGVNGTPSLMLEGLKDSRKGSDLLIEIQSHLQPINNLQSQ